MEQIIQFDKDLFLYLNNLGCTTFDQFWLTITNKITWIPLYLLFVYLIWKNFGVKQLLLLVVLSALLITTTDQITNLFKDYFQRLRPCHREEFFGLMRYVKSHCGGQFGFSSGHASNHFAIAVFMGLLFKKTYKWLLPILLIWAGFIAYSRVYIGVHFPLDISVGTLMGVTFGWIYFKIYQKIIKSFSIFE